MSQELGPGDLFAFGAAPGRRVARAVEGSYRDAGLMGSPGGRTRIVVKERGGRRETPVIA
jgi:hypothetical protein